MITFSEIRIVFIHGFCQSHYNFIKQISAEKLAGFDILAYDLRGTWTFRQASES
ncbi:alpha/beta fold hydrolase [Paraburkholderia sp. BL21I4N1]|uniref:alpha/beta fold hydrolase n=1 Tax=Paraburkholderia sp. BL21I4N1 TaxID=1938801 RepID=UPI0035BE6CC2